MNIDIRLKNNFFRHPKTKKLEAELGKCAPLYLIKIWIFASEFYPDGILVNISDQFLENEIGWPDDSGKSLIQTLVNIGFIEREDNNIIIHDWQEHNSYASESDNRANKGRFSRLKQVFPAIADYLQAIGISSISKENYQKISSSENPFETAKTIFKASSSNKGKKQIQKSKNDPTGYPEGTLQSDPLGTPGVDFGSNTNTSTKPSTNTNTSSNINNLNTISSEQKNCSEQPEALQGGIINSEQEIFIKLPLIDGSEFSVTKERVKFWSECFPAANIEQEFRTMKAWLFAHEKRRKTKGGINRFIQGWLAKAQDNPRNKSSPQMSNNNNAGNMYQDQYVFDENKKVAQRWLEREQNKQEIKND